MGFGFALLGTFLVRSGVLTSVHAFAVDPRRGIAVLVLLGIALGVGFGLYGWRAGKLKQPAGFAAISRESMLVWNNFGLAVAAGVVLIGTIYPLIVEALGGGLISVGPPFFNATVAPLLGLLFVLLPVGPMLTWRIGDIGSALKRLTPAMIIGVATLVVALLMTEWRVAPAVGLAIGVWLVLGGLVYLWTRIARGEGRSFAKILALPLAVWSMSIAHIGAGVLTIGAISETAFRSERAAALAPGQSIDFANRRITLMDIGGVDGPNYEATRANFRVDHNGDVAALSAERRVYETSPMPTTEVGILTSLDGDLYVALGEPVRDSAAWGVRLYHNPAIQFIFGGALMMAIGGSLSLVALARRRKSA
jgi:cytochrome c-type biogenesis protein CcmF